MKIICFGDSLTRGVTSVKGRLRITKKNYPYYLEECLKFDSTVVNKGVFNDHSDSLLKRLQKDVLDENPDYVIIGIGGNDCNFNWKEVVLNPEMEHQPIVPAGRFTANMKTMIEKMIMAGITPIVMTLLPLDPVRYYQYLFRQYGSTIGHWISMKGGMEHWHGMYNERLLTLADEMHVAVADVRTALRQAGTLNELISGDGIHLTSAGYRVAGREISHLIKRKT
ncbi:SGNH/GDSL hydrolase family protein [Bacillus sp. FJAT-42376]|uniref:SGNH/GDSL hydrolase family protein n=1 Tax=Bacillus sp. FJAT-42376 TaxID=2014076 RepID=UPI000F507159|nr:SGNH/GDSL hydrolase family protein [Bacillus sp. FJAT-42376]AZB41527.1 SGNH/GDSL hydrolase family protein [Bacillus sp. FJAT-42376]